MLPLNLTKHRNKHVPNAPYLFQRSGPARPIRSLLKSSVNQDRIDGIISPITILGTFLLAKKTLQQIASLWAGTRGLPQGKWNFLHALSQALKLKISMHPPRERAKRRKKKSSSLDFCGCARIENVHFTSYFNLSPTSKTLFKTKRANTPSEGCRCHFMCFRNWKQVFDKSLKITAHHCLLSRNTWWHWW